MNDRIRIIKSVQDSIYGKLALEDVNVSPIENAKMVSKILEILLSNYYQTNIDSFPEFIISVHGGDINNIETKFNENILKESLESGILHLANFIEIKETVTPRLFESELILSPPRVLELSNDHPQIKLFFVRKNSLDVFFNGKYISSISNIFNEHDSRGYNSRSSITQLDNIVSRYREYFQKHVSPVYWKNKTNRILVNRPEGFLAYFLYQFLQNFISDGQVDGECLNGDTSNRLDIRVTHYLTNKIYIFEVKWIGKSDGQEYLKDNAHNRANSGIEQLKIYLEDDPNCISGVLVLYDARIQDDEINWKDMHLWDHRIYSPPFRLFIKSESASVRASKLSKDK